MADRPMTQRELKKLKAADSTDYVSIYNRQAKQPLQIQLRSPKGVDFYLGEQTIYIPVGQSAKFPKGRLYKEQIVNHQKAGRCTILSGSLD